MRLSLATTVNVPAARDPGSSYRCAGGEGAEIDGLAMVAQEKGAAAVLASLWPVADVSTPALMREYYARREAGAPRPEALQAAQVAMIRGTLGPAGEREPGWRRPFFWAPFILLGSAR